MDLIITYRDDDLCIKALNGKSIYKSELTANIKNIMNKNQIPGISIAIINENELVFHNAIGVKNFKNQENVNNASIFEGASLSKPIFAYFVLKLVEQGVLDLDVPLHKYMKHSAIDAVSQEAYKQITARMVLSHQTGFPNHALGETIRLAFEPGTDFMYSGEGYQYLARCIGTIKDIDTGVALNELFRGMVTRPLNMDNTTFAWNPYIETHKVYGHDEKGQPTQNKPGTSGWDGKTFNSYSSIHTNAYEYAQFIIAMLSRKGLSPETFDEMLKEHTHFKDDNPLKKEIGQTGWGLGFAQKRTSDYTMHMHTGNNHDFQAYTMFIPEKKYGLVVFANCGNMIPFLMGLSEIIGPQF